MSCELDSVKIIKGSDHTIRAELRNPDGTAFDLSAADEVMASFTLQSGGNGTLSLTTGEVEIVQPPELGALILTLSDTFTGTLKTGTRQMFEVKVDMGDITNKVQFLDALDVIASKT